MQRNRGLSPLVSAVLLIALTLAGATVVYAFFTSTFTSRAKMIEVQITSVFLVRVGGESALAGVVVKNTGTVPVVACQVTFYGDQYESIILDVGSLAVGNAKNATQIISLKTTGGDSYPVMVYAESADSSYTTSIAVTCED
jgi:flagellin-like protein